LANWPAQAAASDCAARNDGDLEKAAQVCHLWGETYPRDVAAPSGDEQLIVRHDVKLFCLTANFALAYAALGNSYYDLGEAGLAVTNLTKAYELRDRVDAATPGYSLRDSAGTFGAAWVLIRVTLAHKRTGKSARATQALQRGGVAQVAGLRQVRRRGGRFQYSPTNAAEGNACVAGLPSAHLV